MLRHVVLGLLVGLTLLALPARAQDEAAVAEWQGVITAQVEAFRANDGATALSFAGASIQASFPDPRTFVQWIKDDGYDPIVESLSHNFGPYKMVSPRRVVQDVKFVGKDQGLYDAQYWLELEDGGWRVHRVLLTRTPGVGA
jgi:hypothetical protein